MATMIGTRETSPINKDMYLAENMSVMGIVTQPGTSHFRPVVEEELQRLVDSGGDTKCVVLGTFYTGVGENDWYKQGQVRPISDLIAGYGVKFIMGEELDKKVSPEILRKRIKRVLSIGAIRLALRDEANQEFVEVNLNTEGQAVQDERSRRLAAEAENAVLQERLALANQALIAADPSRADASGTAQKETVSQPVTKDTKSTKPVKGETSVAGTEWEDED